MIEAIEIALASAKAATAIIKELEVDAEVKTHIREFSTTIIDLQNSLLDLQSRLYDSEHETEILRGQVRKIQEVNAKKKNFVFRERFYWKNGDDRPFCPKCWEKDEKQIHLSGPRKYYKRTRHYCEVCQTSYYL